MSTANKESSESQSTLSVPNERDSQSNASEERHDLNTSLNLLALSTKAQQVVSSSRRSCSSSANNPVFSRNPVANNVSPLRALLILFTHEDPQERFRMSGDHDGSRYLITTKFLEKFRQSNSYPPLGTSTDLNRFEVSALATEFEIFIHEKGGDAENENGEEAELDQIPQSHRSIVYHLAYGLFFGSIIDLDIDKEVHDFWDKFASKVTRSD